MDAFSEAVRKRMMADVPVAVFLSGGLDSSMVAAMAKRHLPKSQPVLHSFSVGISPDAPDLQAARKVAKHIGTEHHEYIFSAQEGFDAIESVVWHLETYDPSPIRSGAPMLLLCKLVSQYAKVCLCGEAADEVLAGYLYFASAATKDQLHVETVRKVQNLHGLQLQFQVS